MTRKLPAFNFTSTDIYVTHETEKRTKIAAFIRLMTHKVFRKRHRSHSIRRSDYRVSFRLVESSTNTGITFLASEMEKDKKRK